MSLPFVVEDTTPEAHGELVRELARLEERGSRVGGMREALGAMVVSRDPRERYLLRDDSWNLAFQLQEHWAYWAGANPGHVQRYNTQMEEYMVDGELPGSAYGDRMRNTAGHDQIGRALDQLRESPGTRRALIAVHQPAVEDYSGGDVACTAYLHPFVRDGDLHMVAALRSQDMHWGYAYDAANNQFIQEAMAEELGVGLGEYRHLMDSCHYYTEMEDDVLAAADSGEALRGPPLDLPDGVSFEREFHALSEFLALARDPDGFDGHLGLTMEALDQLESAFFRDWAKVMAAYELERFRDGDSGQMARQFAAWAGDNGWGDWIRRYTGVDGGGR